ncbi:MAG TPA: response regulator transcription factor [Ktedonobacteraceae bacterium]|jgi:DNA-binding NarL/FixJ family response regulator|nr:response regulator transcription factor [Ktedonobacteraceae bacterium]
MIPLLEKSAPLTFESIRSHPDHAVKVMIIDSHTLLRQALHRLVATFSHLQVCADLATLQQAPLLLQQTQVHVITLGSSIPVSECLQFARFLLEHHASVGLVVIQNRLTPETTMTLIKQGIHGLLGEAASEEDLARAITVAAAGGTFLDRRASEILATSVSRAPLHFTSREVEVLSLLKRGESNCRIAHLLGVKEKTIEKHLSHIYEKLHVNSRAGAILQTQRLYI